jgi:hypothetical protein
MHEFQIMPGHSNQIKNLAIFIAISFSDDKLIYHFQDFFYLCFLALRWITFRENIIFLKRTFWSKLLESLPFQ